MRSLSLTLALACLDTLLSPVAARGPCDIYASGRTPCVAAHSTTRALYAAYGGALYQITRNSDGNTTTISPTSAGGVANAAAQDSFCAGTTCLISVIYDQSGNANHLTAAPPGGAASGADANGYDELAAADGAPVTLNGHKAYGVFVSPGTGYRNDKTKGISTADEPQGIYAVLDGSHYNGACCFDYGNAEVSNTDTGNGHMQTVYYGDCTIWGSGAGSGPWIMADLENGLFSGQGAGLNSADPAQSSRFITALTKGQSNNWAIRGGNAQSGNLSTYFNGARPSGYNPMHQEGAIVLGIGGDNSNGAQGTFYEGVMTAEFPSDDIENAVQANIVAAGYAVTTLTSGPSVTVGSTVSMRVTTPGYNTRYIAHNGTKLITEVVTSSSPTSLKQQASFKVTTGLGQSQCVSFESVDTPGSYIRQYAFELYVETSDGSKQFAEDATYCPQAGLSGQGSSIRSWNYPTRFFRHYNNVLYVASEGGPDAFDNPYSYNNDVSFVLATAFAS